MKLLRTISVLTALLLAACSGSASTVTVSKVLLAGELNAKGEIESMQTSFLPTQDAIFAHAFVEGHTSAILLRGEWWFDGGKEPPKKIYEALVTVLPDRPVAMFTIQSTQQWPIGDYRLLLFIEEKQLIELKFTVEKPI